ncbi:MAG: DNA translocase FtsK [Pontibacterium sp.]
MNFNGKGQRLEYPSLIARVLKESTLIITIGINLFLLLALLGYDARDPGWSHLGYQPEVRNFTGITGAWLADMSLSAVGVCAYLIPLLVVIPSLRFLLRKDVGIVDAIPFFILRTTGALLLTANAAGLAATHFDNQVLELPFSAGGLLGEALSDQAVAFFGIAGSSVLLFTLLLFGLTLFMEVSWSRMLESAGRGLIQAFNYLKARLDERLRRDKQHESYSEDGPENSESDDQEAGSADPQFSVPLVRPAEHSPRPERIEPVFFDTPGNIQDVDPLLQGTPRPEPATPAPALQPSDFPDFEPPETPQVKPVIPESEPEPEPEPINEAESEPECTFKPEPVPEFEPESEPQPEVAFGPASAPERSEPLAPASPPPVVPVPVIKEAEPVAENPKNLRIVPLSETHKPMQDRELGMEPDKTAVQAPAPKMRIPPLDELDPPSLNQSAGYSPEQLESMSRLLESKLKDFNVIAEVVEVNPGPVITRFEIQPAPGVKASKISNLAKDLARSMAVSSVRVVEVIAGKSVIGIEIPNEERQMVSLSEVLNSKAYLEASSKLTLGLGNDIGGNPVVANLAKMPHLLVAGTTGSGKSVGVNAMLLSLLFKATPDEVRLIMVDPKMLELSIYDGIPHLLTPVITDMKDAAAGLRWCVAEMEDRYRLMAKMGVRNLAGFNDKIEKARKLGEPLKDPLWNPEDYGMPPDSPAPDLQTLPYIVVVIDEFADMMMIVGKKVEELIARIAQKARAAGIHLILATQRPSVDVITGLIKANIPTRIAFQVSSKIDSRTILDQSGAENLLGWGDMLYLPAGTSLPNRIHGAFVSDDEVHRVVEAWKKISSPVYIDEILNSDSGGSVITGSGSMFDDEQDSLYDEAVAFVTETRKASISSVQRRLKIGYNRSARMIEAMEAAGVVSAAGNNGQRDVLAPPPVKD